MPADESDALAEVARLRRELHAKDAAEIARLRQELCAKDAADAASAAILAEKTLRIRELEQEVKHLDDELRSAPAPSSPTAIESREAVDARGVPTPTSRRRADRSSEGSA